MLQATKWKELTDIILSERGKKEISTRFHLQKIQKQAKIIFDIKSSPDGCL